LLTVASRVGVCGMLIRARMVATGGARVTDDYVGDDLERQRIARDRSIKLQQARYSALATNNK